MFRCNGLQGGCVGGGGGGHTSYMDNKGMRHLRGVPFSA